MKLSFFFALGLAAGLICGCSHTHVNGPVALDRIGPAPLPDDHSHGGTLMVFSALTKSMPGNVFPDHVHHTDYKILSEDGHLLRSVHNDYDNSWEGPREVELPPGNYRVEARSAKYGIVTVPVLIAPHQVTRVNLTGSSMPWEKEPAHDGDLVRLPNGEIVGCVAPVTSTARGHLTEHSAR